ncbi:hypothetical protein HYR54_02625 [Candidatus Acetothermia bacterium]|nr:hypothetical protein [Candidatus Acetothermia bacterium]MBI3459725.1 hypothetical protein [Candidatus Acetothermia bacterium]
MLTNDWYYLEQYIPEYSQNLQRQAHTERLVHFVPSVHTRSQKIRIHLGYLLVRAGYQLMKPRALSVDERRVII